MKLGKIALGYLIVIGKKYYWKIEIGKLSPNQQILVSNSCVRNSNTTGVGCIGVFWEYLRYFIIDHFYSTESRFSFLLYSRYQNLLGKYG